MTNEMISAGAIARIWRGYTSVQNADKLERLFLDEAIPSIESNKPNGLKGLNLFRLDSETEVEFTTVMYFDSLESVKEFAGEDYQRAHIDPAVGPLLLRYDKVVKHHVVKETKFW